jgi:CO/xanthine dehydrogenase Mo-binding subunit
MSRGVPSGLSRRDVLAAGGALVLSFSLGGAGSAAAQRLPGSLSRSKRLDSWIRVGADGRVTVLTGKVEIGQGIKTALAQIAADELDVDLARIDMVTADTARTPNEGYTAGSMSIQTSGVAVRHAAAEVRQLLVAGAATRLGAPAERLAVTDGVISVGGGGGASVSYWELVEGDLIEREATGEVAPKQVDAYRYVGRPVPRLDLPAKVFGEAVFVHDLRLEGMLHARVVRPPSYGARLGELKSAAVEALPGVVEVVRDGSFLAVVAEREEQAVAAAEALSRQAQWSPGRPLPATSEVATWLREQTTRDATVHAVGAEPAEVVSAVQVEADYFKPYLAHAAIAPSCAVAEERDGELSVWTHSQGVFPLRAALSEVVGLEAEKIRCVHMDGAGCYGHNGADDAACDAAVLARRLPGRPVRVLWSREDELRWAPFGAAMSLRLRGGLDDEGRIVSWQHELWSNPHSTRPGRQPTFLAGWHRAEPLPPPNAFAIPLPSGGGTRNSVPLYDFPNQRVIRHFLPEMPVRVSALRSLGAFANVFAIECFMDEMAEAASVDPVEFRLRHTSDSRASAVIEAAAERAEWKSASTTSPPAPEASARRGRGFAFARYKNQGSYLALVVDVVVAADESIQIEKATAAVDAGLVINPDGLRNQIAGGIVQSLSWGLFEEVVTGRAGIASKDWRFYPIMRFPQVPEVEVVVIDRPDEPSMGAGEAAQGPAVAALCNAVYAATGVRQRSLPIAREQVV